MRKYSSIFASFVVFAIAFLVWDTDDGYYIKRANPAAATATVNTVKDEPIKFKRDTTTIDYSHITFTPWDVESSSTGIQPQREKPYTLMLYMNGSDLESENGAATNDLVEMLDSGLESKNANLIIFTGGANRWQNDVIPENDCRIWKIEDGALKEVTSVGLVNMGDAGTLSSFIQFSIKNFPANKYGLIMWDHGGGSIAGYGHDEKFIKGNLTLLDMDYAFKSAGLSENKLEFLGFDSCLMSSVEMAVVASDYSRYMVASEDLEPGDGWDYSFLAVLNKDPNIDGKRLCMAVTDYFMNYYGRWFNQSLTMSVVDLSKAAGVMDAMGTLMESCTEELFTNRESSFSMLARRRNGTKTFGEGSPRDNECDMVDIGDMVNNLYDIFPMEVERVVAALNSAVVYNRHNSKIEVKGLSTYYIYGGKDMAWASLPTYESLNMSNMYTDYLYSFYGMLGRAGITRSSWSTAEAETLKADLTMWEAIKGKDGSFIMTGIQEYTKSDGDQRTKADEDVLWPSINGKNICMYSVSDDISLYAVPIQLNGEDCDLMILLDNDNPDGKILGARRSDGYIIQKGYDNIELGDKIAIYFMQRSFSEKSSDKQWVLSDTFTIEAQLQLEWSKAKEGTYYRLLYTDIRLNESFGDLF